MRWTIGLWWHRLRFRLFGFDPREQYGDILVRKDSRISMLELQKKAEKQAKRFVPWEYWPTIRYGFRATPNPPKEDPFSNVPYVAWKTTPVPGRYVLRLRWVRRVE